MYNSRYLLHRIIFTNIICNVQIQKTYRQISFSNTKFLWNINSYPISIYYILSLLSFFYTKYINFKKEKRDIKSFYSSFLLKIFLISIWGGKRQNFNIFYKTSSNLQVLTYLYSYYMYTGAEIIKYYI